MVCRRPSNAALSRLGKLRTRKGRERLGRFLVEGRKVVAEAFQAGLRPHTILIDEKVLAGQDPKTSLGMPEGCESLMRVLSDKEFGALATTTHSQGILAEFEKPSLPGPRFLEVPSGPIVVLHEVRDPGNVGTVIRSAAALGAAGVITTRGCAEIWNPKTVRATSGALFRIPILESFLPEEVRRVLLEKCYRVWVADPRGDSLGEIIEIPGRLALVFGNESRGAGEIWSGSNSIRKVGIPPARGVESLNVAMAATAMLAVLNPKFGQSRPTSTLSG